MPRYLTPHDIAETLHLHINTVRRYIRGKEFPNARLIRNSYRIPEQDLEEFLERCTQKWKESQAMKGRADGNQS